MRLTKTTPEVERMLERRRFVTSAAAGTALVILGGGSYVLACSNDSRNNLQRPDGRPKVPPGQRVIDVLRPMGGIPGDPAPQNMRLRIHGEVDSPFELDFDGLLAMPQTEQLCDVHCVTGWTLLDSRWKGVQVRLLAEQAKVRSDARFVIFEAAQGYTSNVPLQEALAPNVLIAHQYEGNAIPEPHGPPARALVPDLYFWKSAKWLTGIEFSAVDKPGYWERRGYHNHADPWKEERFP